MPGDTFLVYRTDIMLRFKRDLPDRDKMAFFRANRISVIGVTFVGTFFVRMPDRGTSWQAFDAALQKLSTEPEVAHATFIPRTPWPAADFADAAADTARPPFPPLRLFFPEDTIRSVVPPYDSALRYYRALLGVKFDDTTSGLRVRSVLARFQAQILAGAPNIGAYFVRVPDPGPEWAAFDALMRAVRQESGVNGVFPLMFRERSTVHDDGSAQQL